METQTKPSAKYQSYIKIDRKQSQDINPARGETFLPANE